jgi:hypothetical protein
MGDLVAMHYPAKLFAKLADHTYVECGTGGKTWSCWGGNSGGTELRRAAGSTARADAIAEPSERAGITCYLVNGVCHQAANRILLPAGTTVSGARGYDVSEALFGTYGRPRGVLGFCDAPFDQHPGVTGDLPACAMGAMADAQPLGRSPRRPLRRVAAQSPRERGYLRRVRAMYARQRPAFAKTMRTAARASAAERDLEDFQVQLFQLKVDYHLGTVARRTQKHLETIRRASERSRMKVEEWFLHRQMSPKEFAAAIDRETERFQHEMAGALSGVQYRRLLGTAPGETVVLADPRIVKSALKRFGLKRRG